MKIMKLSCNWCEIKSEEFVEPDPYKAINVEAVARVMDAMPAVGHLVEPIADPYPKGWYSFALAPMGRNQPEIYGELCPSCFTALQKFGESRKTVNERVAIVRPITKVNS